MEFLSWSWLKQTASRARCAARYTTPGIVGYYWDGGAPREHLVKEISLTGAYLCAPERWYVGTILSITLQEEGSEGGNGPRSPGMTIPCKVAHQGLDGFGVTFMLRNGDRKKLNGFIQKVVARRAERAAAAAAGASADGSASLDIVGAGNGMPAREGSSSEGQALIEYALMVPLLFLLIVNAVNFGYFLYTWITVSNASRAGVQYAVLSGASAGALTPATGSQVTTVVTNDMGSLPGTPTVNVCKKNNGTVTTLAGTCSNVPTDPEDPLYVTTMVEVSYTYTPPLGALSFPKLGINATIPPTSLDSRTIMRSIQ